MEKKGDEGKDSFRDSISTISELGKRAWIYAQKPVGKLYRLRTWLSVVYLVTFFTLPFIKVNGEPLFLINILERKFIIFGVVFWSQDLFLFGLGMLIFIVFIVLFTVIFGRIFCGWACPQTIFMEMVFRRIEYWIEGDASHQKILDKQPWNTEKILKKGGKAIAFFLVSYVIANTFLSYIISVDEVGKIYTDPISETKGTLTSLLIFTAAFYFVYAWFREQVCLIVCPYGRLQGVLLDKNSIVVAYDYVRGEPRAKFSKNHEGKGDCIDCHQCVKVCPTGIDIRNGTQLECVNCTACIDVCDHMMESVGYEKGLIRYDSEKGIAEKKKLKLSPRIVGYSVVLIVLIGVLVTLLASRTDIETSILRTPGMLYQVVQGEDKISNLYNFKLINKTHYDMDITFHLSSGDGVIKMAGKDTLHVKKEGLESGVFSIILDKDKITERKTKLTVDVYSKDKLIERVVTSFLGPVGRK